jgi:hypothetical protein
MQIGFLERWAISEPAKGAEPVTGLFLSIGGWREVYVDSLQRSPEASIHSVFRKLQHG